MAANNRVPEGDPLFAECANKMVFNASDRDSATNGGVSDVLYPFEDIGRDLHKEHLVEHGFPLRFLPDE
ncbi:MAG: hypothetical protein KIH44_003085, partial [Octadecabacter sp.]|nr:hypothetical protein [Octadecabacter sp.]